MNTLLVASATANTGAKVVQQLSASGKANVRALVRNPDSDAAKALVGLPHVTLVKGDFNDPPSLREACKGVSRAFLVSPPGEHEQFDREVAFIDAANDAGVEAVVRIATAAVLMSTETTCVYARAHARVENYIAEHKRRVIDLQPNWYMTNLLWQAAEAKATGKITYPVTPEQCANSRFAAVDTRDVAGAAVACLLANKDQLAKLLAAHTLEVHGPAAVTFGEQLAAISAVAGKPVTFNPIAPDAWKDMLVSVGMSELMAGSFRDTVLTVVGAKPGYRPFLTKTSDALLAIWQPKYSIQDWAKEYGAAF